MVPVSIKERLPRDGQYVLAFFPDLPWIDSGAKNNEHKWVVVKFVRGISLDERNALPDNDERKIRYRASDQHGNNHKPYCWDTFGPGSFFGQEALLWCDLPSI